MTREQAIKRATEGMQATGARWSEGAVAADVAILEALGLLKFDEPSDRFIQPKTHFAPPKTHFVPAVQIQDAHRADGQGGPGPMGQGVTRNAHRCPSPRPR
jgi:hypothetical protein